MIFGKDLGRSAFFAEIGSEVERLDNIPSDYTNLVCIGQGVSLTDTVGREYRIDLFISPTGRVAVRLPLPLAGASPTDADPKHLRRVASIVRAWNAEQLNEVCADHFYRAEGQAADIIDVLVRAGLAGFITVKLLPRRQAVVHGVEMQAPSGTGFERVLKQLSLSARPENESRASDLLCRRCDDNLPVRSANVWVCVCAEATVKVDGDCLLQRLRVLFPTLFVVCPHLLQYLLCQFRRASSALS